jgi:CRISPR system Cascade subunit CasC
MVAEAMTRGQAYSPLRRGFMIKKNLVIQLELLRSHAVACLNRGEYGEVKTVTFGGMQRLRISSQCWKRAVREAMHEKLGAGRGYRTKYVGAKLAKRLHISEPQSQFLGKLIVYALIGQKLEKEDSNTLLFVSDSELDAIAALFIDPKKLKRLLGLYDELVSKHKADEAAKKAKRENNKKAKAAKAAGEAPVTVETPPETAVFDDSVFNTVKSEIVAAVKSAAHGWDIALHGRMTANSKTSSVDGALSIAHSFTVHEAQPEADYFSTLDDLRPDTESGSAHLGEAEFGSGTFYTYATLDVLQLIRNLFKKPSELLTEPLTVAQYEHEHLTNVILEWLKASIFALPRARKNTMNADSLPGYVRVSITKDGIPVNHAAAFEHFHTNGESVTQKAIEKLEQAAKRAQEYFGIKPAESWAINPEPKSIDPEPKSIDPESKSIDPESKFQSPEDGSEAKKNFTVDEALTGVADFLAKEIEVAK